MRCGLHINLPVACGSTCTAGWVCNCIVRQRNESPGWCTLHRGCEQKILGNRILCPMLNNTHADLESSMHVTLHVKLWHMVAATRRDSSIINPTALPHAFFPAPCSATSGVAVPDHNCGAAALRPCALACHTATCGGCHRPAAATCS